MDFPHDLRLLEMAEDDDATATDQSKRSARRCVPDSASRSIDGGKNVIVAHVSRQVSDIRRRHVLEPRTARCIDHAQLLSKPGRADGGRDVVAIICWVM